MDTGLTLEELKIADWNREIIVDDGCDFGAQVMLFWKNIYVGTEVTPGFEFHCVDWFSCDASGVCPTYQTLFQGSVLFDGVRHIYFGNEATNNYGYLYYCDVPNLIKALARLDELQVEKCPYVREERMKEQQEG